VADIKLSVVVPVLLKSLKHIAMTQKCLDLARKCTQLPFELVIVESGTQHLAEEADVYIYEKKVTTPEISHNRGFKSASGDYIALLTNDVFVSDGWLECLLDCFKISDCGASTLGSTQFHHVKNNTIEEGNWWSVVMIKKDVFEKVGYYDERYINSWCDTDLLMRMYLSGYKMYRNFNCIVEHLVGQTIYDKPDFHKNYSDGQRLFNEKFQDCGHPLFNQLR
jgi:glycosyltransferase involved in cell wall biosynthesis